MIISVIHRYLNNTDIGYKPNHVDSVNVFPEDVANSNGGYVPVSIEFRPAWGRSIMPGSRYPFSDSSHLYNIEAKPYPGQPRLAGDMGNYLQKNFCKFGDLLTIAVYKNSTINSMTLSVERYSNRVYLERKNTSNKEFEVHHLRLLPSMSGTLIYNGVTTTYNLVLSRSVQLRTDSPAVTDLYKLSLGCGADISSEALWYIEIIGAHINLYSIKQNSYKELNW